jgi:hypothetical protein
MTDERVLSVWIGVAPHGVATVQVVARGSDGERLVVRRRGLESEMREFVRDLAGQHDLVPIWDDTTWLDDGSRRPPAPFYTTRDLAPPTSLAMAS